MNSGMNDSISGAPTPRRALLATIQWSMAVGHRVRSDGQPIYHADIFRNDAFVHRVMLSGPVVNRIAAEVALTELARKWISNYETKDHTGVTQFGEPVEL
jgi:hypothetical protein